MKNGRLLLLAASGSFGFAAAQAPVSLLVLVPVLAGAILLGSSAGWGDGQTTKKLETFPVPGALAWGERLVLFAVAVALAGLAWIYLASSQTPAIGIIALLGTLAGEVLRSILTRRPEQRADQA